jgi:hypothetical protein
MVRQANVQLKQLLDRRKKGLEAAKTPVFLCLFLQSLDIRILMDIQWTIGCP